MNRLVLAAATAAAACGVAIPAIAGLSGNPSFSQRIPVHLPSSAHVVQFDEAGSVVRTSDDASRSPSTVPSSTSTHAWPAGTTSGAPTVTSGTSRHEAEPGDDRTAGAAEPGDDRTARPAEPGDDHGTGNRGRDGRSSDDGGR
jgi:hypothetical protein